MFVLSDTGDLNIIFQIGFMYTVNQKIALNIENEPRDIAVLTVANYVHVESFQIFLPCES